MPVNTGVSALLRRPQTFHNFTYSFASRGLTPLPLRIALIGAKTSAGTGVAGTVYEISDAPQADGLFGVGSELALMCRKAFETGAKLQRGPKVFAVPVAESAGVANVKTITGTGAATADGNIIVRVAGRTFTIGVRSGDSANTIATAISNGLKTNAENLPVVVTVATNVVTLTHATKGVNGIDVVVTVEQNVAGNAQAVANTVVGTAVTDHQAALDALAPMGSCSPTTRPRTSPRSTPTSRRGGTSPRSGGAGTSSASRARSAPRRPSRRQRTTKPC
jgi:phage tail sheath gpL-like